MHWLDSAGLPQLQRTMPPGDACTFQTFETHAWLVCDARSRCVVDQCFVSSPAEMVEITDSDLWSARVDRNVTVNFTNSLPFTARLMRVDASGNDQPVAILKPNEATIRPSVQGEP